MMTRLSDTEQMVVKEEIVDSYYHVTSSTKCPFCSQDVAFNLHRIRSI